MMFSLTLFSMVQWHNIGVGTGGARGAIAPPLFLEVARWPEGCARLRFISIAEN